MPHKLHHGLNDASLETGIERSLFVEFVRRKWLTPALLVEDVEACELDDEDIARTNLILELRRDFGVNDEAIPIILHLIDELNAVRAKLIHMQQHS